MSQKSVLLTEIVRPLVKLQGNCIQNAKHWYCEQKKSVKRLYLLCEGPLHFIEK